MQLQAKILMVLGGALVILPPAILFTIFGNKEITGLATSFLPFTPLFILGGIILFVIGFSLRHPNAPDVITEKLHLNNPVMNAAVKRTNNWVWWFALSLLWLPSLVGQWSQEVSIPFLARLDVWLLPVALLIGIVFGKLFWKIPWHVVLIGDYDLKSRDEREASILQHAAQYTLAATMLYMTAICEILVIAPRPSTFSIIELFVITWFLIRGTYGFIAWKLGLR